MTNSIKNLLYLSIKHSYPHPFTLDDIDRLARREKVKVSYAERELRHLTEEKVIKPIWEGKRYIKAYEWIRPVDNSTDKKAPIGIDSMF